MHQLKITVISIHSMTLHYEIPCMYNSAPRKKTNHVVSRASLAHRLIFIATIAFRINSMENFRYGVAKPIHNLWSKVQLCRHCLENLFLIQKIGPDNCTNFSCLITCLVIIQVWKVNFKKLRLVALLLVDNTINKLR